MSFKVGDKVRGKDPAGAVRDGVVSRVDTFGPGVVNVSINWADGSSTTQSDTSITALVPGMKPSQLQTSANNPTAAEMKREVEASMMSLMGATVGGILGAVLWKEHRYVGFFSGASAGSAAVCLKNKRYAAALGDAAAGSLGAYISLRNPKHPALGYVGGHMLGKFAGGMLGSLLLPDNSKK